MLFVIVCVLSSAVFIGGHPIILTGERINAQPCGVEVSANLVHQNPWMVFLEFQRRGHLTELRCGGTLINKRHIITAAHCIKKIAYSKIIVRLGEYDLTNKVDCVQGICIDPIVRLEVSEAIVHPEYDGKEHDIAILRLKEDAPYTDFIRPVCLPTGQLTKDVTFTAAGWGEIPKKGRYSNTKKIVPLPNWSRDACQKAYKHIPLPASVVCAGGEDGIDTCRGDSGGPLTWHKDVVELWGVTSTGNERCGAEGYPGIYTSVVDYLEWIKAVVSVERSSLE